jgi:lipoate-protein ligase A
MKRAEYKVPGGKLLAAELGVEGGRLVGVKITGDFFMHPEAAIIELEKALNNTPVEDLENNLKSFFQDNDVTLFGVEAGDFVKVVRLALES